MYLTGDCSNNFNARYRVVRTVELNTSYYVDVADDVDVQQLADMNPEYDGLDIEYVHQ